MTPLRAAFFLLLILSSLVGCDNKTPTPLEPVIRPAKVLVVGELDEAIAKQFPAVVRAGQRVDLAFRVPGRLTELLVREGESVDAGQLIGKLDDSDYVSKVNAAQAEVNKNQANFSRAKELIIDNFISRTDFEKLKAAYEVSVSNLEQAEKALADTRLVAPFSGSIARTLVENFQDVQAMAPVISLQDRKALEVVINISESQVARNPGGLQLTYQARFDALPEQPFTLYPKEFSTEANPDTQAFEAVLGIEGETNNKILPGMTATVVISATATRQESQILTVPLSAIVAGENDQTSIWLVAADNTVSLKAIDTGTLFGNDQIQVTSGLNKGDTIVIAGTSYMSPGLAINPISQVDY